MIILSGNIGAGKSNLAKILSQDLGTKAFFEPVADNPVLPLYYADPDKYAFLLQIYFLNQRFAMIKKAMSDDNNVLDRSIYEDSLFFHVNADMGRATTQEVSVYEDLLDNMMEELPYAAKKKSPDLLVHIDVSLDTMLARIEKRGRDYEQVSAHPELLDYYKRLVQAYNTWYEEYDQSPKIKIDGDKYDFVENEADRQKVLRQIHDKLTDVRKPANSLSSMLTKLAKWPNDY